MVMIRVNCLLLFIAENRYSEAKADSRGLFARCVFRFNPVVHIVNEVEYCMSRMSAWRQVVESKVVPY